MHSSELLMPQPVFNELIPEIREVVIKIWAKKVTVDLHERLANDFRPGCKTISEIKRLQALANDQPDNLYAKRVKGLDILVEREKMYSIAVFYRQSLENLEDENESILREIRWGGLDQ